MKRLDVPAHERVFSGLGSVALVRKNEARVIASVVAVGVISTGVGSSRVGKP